MMNPFKAMLNDRQAEAGRMVIAIVFEREVRSGAVLIARQPKFSKQNIDKPLIAELQAQVNF
ncbi:hypothetical protein [Pararhizobium qamdonense]|uniref:hypothetical protein n=1 Tax=Pararhizobium qamdonense TaxID=3031126 RepID=UPI0023E248C0|nr:hypothetical protein [Pararhizobium qamdonense]